MAGQSGQNTAFPANLLNTLALDMTPTIFVKAKVNCRRVERNFCVAPSAPAYGGAYEGGTPVQLEL
jgi:hypothetical protein